MQIEIRLIKKTQDPTQFQLFNRAYFDFYGTVMWSINKLFTVSNLHIIFPVNIDFPKKGIPTI